MLYGNLKTEKWSMFGRQKYWKEHWLVEKLSIIDPSNRGYSDPPQCPLSTLNFRLFSVNHPIQGEVLKIMFWQSGKRYFHVIVINGL